MRSSTARGLIVLAVFLVGAVLAWKLYGAKQEEPRQEVSQGVTRWEYLLAEVYEVDWETQMNKHGAEGWELVFAHRILETYGARLRTLLDSGFRPDFKYQCIFKRPRKP